MVGANRPLNSCIFQSLRATATCQRSKPPRLVFENKEQEDDELIHPSKRKRRSLPEEWYSEKFLKGQWDKEECVTEWQKYRACLSTATLAQKNSEIDRTLAAQDEITRTLAEMGRVRNRKKMIVPVVKNKQPNVDQVTSEKILKSSVFSMSRKKLPSSLSHLEMDLRKLMLPYTALQLKLSSSKGEMRWSIIYKFIQVPGFQDQASALQPVVLQGCSSPIINLAS